MKNFCRALKMASRHWLSIILATFCSMAVAILWGANIGAFLPILKVTINNTSVQEWIQTEIDNQQQIIDELNIGLEDQKQQLAAAEKLPDVEANTANKRDIQARISHFESKLSYHRAQLVSYNETKPLVDKWVPHSPFGTIVMVVGALIGCTLLRHFFLISNDLLVGNVALNISCNLRNMAFNKILRLDRATFEQRGDAGFVSIIIQTTDMLSQGLMNCLGGAMREPFKIIACLVGAACICPRLLILSVLVAPFVGVVLVFLTRHLKQVSAKVLQKATGFHAVLLEGLGNVQTIQAYRREPSEQERFEDATALMKSFGLKFVFLTSLSKPVIEFLGVGMLGTTIIGGAYLVLKQETHLLGMRICDQPLSVEALLIFFGMLVGISDPLRKLSSVYSSIYTGTVAADAIFPLLDEASKIEDAASPQTVARPHSQLHIDSVGFEYTPGQPVLHDIDLAIPFGTTVAIVGGNGCGKSTLINILCRFYDPNSGAMRLDAVDFRDMKVDDVRSRIALVNQQTELFNETVDYNIRYGRPDATQEEVEHYAKVSHAHEFIMTGLENGYQTVVGQNGNRLSGGQRQRIALARALLCNPEILILDEATSQIDMQSEHLIRQSLAEHRGERTTIIITHREKLLELADRVFEMHDGRLTEIENRFRNAA